MSKTKPIQKPNKKQRKISPFLQSSDDEQLANMPAPKTKRNPKSKAKIYEQILQLKKQDFRQYGLRVNWTQDQDAKLIKLKEQDNLGWVEMEKYFPGRTDEACKMRYKKLQHKTDRRWSSYERDKMIELVKQYGENWELLSERLPTKKTPTQIQTYYFKTLPKRGWTADENVKLIEAIKKYQKLQESELWQAVAKQFPGRIPHLIKEHFQVTLGRIAKKKIKRQKQMDENYVESQDEMI